MSPGSTSTRSTAVRPTCSFCWWPPKTRSASISKPWRACRACSRTAPFATGCSRPPTARQSSSSSAQRMRSSDRHGGPSVSTSFEVVVVTGLSGSGKSTAIHVLEDLGFYCIDNLPLVLVSRFLELCTTSLERISRAALGTAIRERQLFAAYPRVLDELRGAGYRLEVVFFDASDDVLVRRFSETRRPHPLGGDAGPLAGIQRERTELSELRARADR